MLLAAWSGITSRSSMPWDSSHRWRPPGTRRSSQSGSRAARSPIVRSPSGASAASVFVPTPHSRPMGSVARKARVSSGATCTGRPAWPDRRRSWPRTSPRRCRPTPAAAVLSRMRRRSSRGDVRRPAEQRLRVGDVQERLVQRQRLDQRRHASPGWRTPPRWPRRRPRTGAGRRWPAAPGAWPRPSTSRCAPRTAAPRTRPPAPPRGVRWPPTITGLPRSSGLSRCSTDA